MHFPKRLLPVFALLAAVSASGSGEKAELPADVLKRFHAAFDREQWDLKRREAVDILKGHSEPVIIAEVSGLIDDLLKRSDDLVIQRFFELLGSHDTPECAARILEIVQRKRTAPKYVLFAREALKPCRSGQVLKLVADQGLASQDARLVESMCDVLAAAGHAPAAPALAKLLKRPEARVRAAAAEALGRCGKDFPAAAAALERLRKDPDPFAADSAVVGLAWLRHQPSWDAIRGIVEKGPWPARCRVIRALGAWEGDEKVMALLVEGIAKDAGRAVPELAAALERVSGQKFGTDGRKWQDWWKGRGNPAWVEEVRTQEGARDYHDVVYHSQRVVFVLDVSSSMEFATASGKDQKRTKFVIAKEGLCKALAELDEKTRFNIITFASYVNPWKKTLVDGTEPARKEAGDFVRKLGVQGNTNIFDALVAGTGALIQTGRKVKLNAYELAGPDTVFLLTDGRPTTGGVLDPYEILATVTFANRFHAMQIYTFALCTDEKEIDPVFLRLLAEWNNGVYKFIAD